MYGCFENNITSEYVLINGKLMCYVSYVDLLQNVLYG